MAHDVSVARRLMRWLVMRPEMPTCFGCIARAIRVQRVVVEALAIGAAATLTNVEVGTARCSVCAATVPTVQYRV